MYSANLEILCIMQLQCDLYGFVEADQSLSVLILPVINASAPVVVGDVWWNL